MMDASAQGGGVIWCHGSQGLEWAPDWIAGLLHAQNIYDGGNEGTFDTVYYPLLNAGLKVPFSTGTDWGIWDFSRVYVTTAEDFTSKVFLRELAEGRSYITNEPFLEFRAGDAGAGDTITLPGAGVVRIRGRAVGRSDFVRLQLVYNGRVVQEVASRPVDGHFEAEMDLPLTVAESGWLALRILPEQPYFIRATYAGPGTNLLGKMIFAHTSPVYLSVAGRPHFDRIALESLMAQVAAARAKVDEVGIFRDSAEKETVLSIYSDAAKTLQALLAAGGRQ